jgi:DNA-binding beta-propeller fold protein YncE
VRNAYALIVLVLGSLAGACQAPAPDKAEAERPSALPVWPQPPDEPRIRYVRSIGAPQDWGVTKSLLRRLVDRIAGKGAEHLVRPMAVAERDGVLYVADPGAQTLWILDAPQNRSVRISEVGSASLVSPVAVVTRPDGAVFVADSALKKVFLLDREGKLISIAAGDGLARPAGLAYDATTQRLYVADAANHRIVVYGADGKLLRAWGRAGVGDGEFNYPSHLALDPAGTLLVTDALNFRIQAFDRDGRFLWKLGRHGDGSGDFAAPKGLATDREGHVYAVDALFDTVQIFARDGSLLLAFGERGTQAGQLWLPTGIYISAQGSIYVADSYNQRVQVFAPARGAANGAKP